MKKVKATISCFSLIIYLLAGSGIAEGFVLCVGADNHRAIEPLHQVHFDFSSNLPIYPLSPFHAGFAQKPNHKEACTDFPIFIADFDQGVIFYKTLISFTAIPDTAVLSDSVITLPQKPEKKYLQLYPSTTKPALNSLRTIILQV
tara:strand:- start:8108 stop:8542 length:435 start_codon:yes stop_codon:yes gene_type:complete